MVFGTLDRLVIMMVPMTLIICVTAVMILRPLTKQLGQILTELQVQRGRGAARDDIDRLVSSVTQLQDRLETLERDAEFDRALRSPAPDQTR
jgi:hypothetical protein